MNDITAERAGRSVSLTWYGQAGFRLTAGHSRVLIDPFLTGRPDRRYQPPAPLPDEIPAGLAGICAAWGYPHPDNELSKVG